MSVLSDYITQIETRITNLLAAAMVNGASVLIEDRKEIENEIQSALEKPGMLILIGWPDLENNGDTKRGPANMTIRSQVGIGEDPTMWRTGNGKPSAGEVASLLMEGLQGLDMDGFEPLRVASVRQNRDPKLQSYDLTIESQCIVQKTGFIAVP